MAVTSQELAQQLLDAQVRFLLAELQPESLQQILAQEVPFLFREFSKLRLRESVAEEKVAATALRYATEMEIEGGIPELIGEIANIIYEHPENETTRVGDVLPQALAEAYLEKIFETGSILDQLITNVRASAPFREFLSDVVFTVAKGYALEQNQLVRMAPVANGLRRFRDWLDTQAPGLSENVHSLGKQVSRAGVDQSIKMVDDMLDNDLYRDTALNAVLDLWDQIKTWELASFRRYFSEMDLQDMMALGYEFWLEFRHTDYLKSCIDAGCRLFFDKYGEETLGTILADIGVTEAMVVSELQNYAPDLARLLLDHNIAEPILRRHLQRFYFSVETLALLSPSCQQDGD